MKFFKKALKNIQPVRQTQIEKDLIRREAQIGGQLFGEVPKGHKREFFCLDERTWVWYEMWKENGHVKEVTTRYEIQDNGVLKTQGSQPYQFASDLEKKHLFNAIKLYHRYVSAYIYNPQKNATIV